jgi:hypothetical protein
MLLIGARLVPKLRLPFPVLLNGKKEGSGGEQDYGSNKGRVPPEGEPLGRGLSDPAASSPPP